MPAEPGKLRRDAGTFRRRKPPPLARWWRPREVDPVRAALEGKVTPERWEELRKATWQRWMELERSWPPKSASHDGIVGEVLRVKFNPSAGYIGGFDARPRIRGLAQEGLDELERFRERRPE